MAHPTSQRPTSQLPSSSLSKVGVVALAALLVFAAYRFGVFERLGEPRELARSLVELGAGGYVAFALAYAFLQPVGIPGTLFVLAAALIWPWQSAFVLSLVGTMAASVVGFSFARFVARDWVAARIPARLHKYDEALVQRGFSTVVSIRLVFWMSQMVHAFLGVSRIGFWTHFWASLVAYIPTVFLISFFAGEAFDESGSLQSGAWRMFAALVVVSLVVARLARAYEQRALPSAPE
ncbi:MAG TPA: VTT domain-containing protein [Polyangiaceae bacterium]|nr:VTT domain-containing protein [Polyangiaceae bacterium]